MSETTRSWLFTINNYTEDDERQVLQLAEHVAYMIVGKEIAPTTNTPHYQGYIYFNSPTSLRSVCKKLTRAHWMVAKGTPKQNEEYCSKSADLLIKKGEIPIQGKRNDIHSTMTQLKEGHNMRAIIEASTSYQSIRIAECWLKYNETGRDWFTTVHWYHGSTGSGKTREARNWLGDDIYSGLDSIKWWEGYDRHENVLIDDMRKDYCKFHQLLKLLDRYPFRVECKGGSRQVVARKIAITCPVPPDVLFFNREDKQQLLRRISQTILIGDPVENHRGGPSYNLHLDIDEDDELDDAEHYFKCQQAEETREFDEMVLEAKQQKLALKESKLRCIGSVVN